MNFYEYDDKTPQYWRCGYDFTNGHFTIDNEPGRFVQGLK